jgi:two-component system, OmpR family, phosphate regulon response regulator PhoB
VTGRARVLVVDDDREILEMTALLLRGAGHEVTLAASGEEALYLVQESPPDLVLLDINMPGFDGWEVLRVLKEDDRTASLPVVMFSVNFEVREKLHALQQGASDYITKPFDTNALLRRVSDVLAAGKRA